MSAAIAHLCLPFPGERAAGDLAWIRRGASSLLFAVVDVLGHGAAAAAEAKHAEQLLETLDPESTDLGRGLDALHRGLRGRRGAAATMVRLHAGELTVAGVGNVGARILGEERLGLYCVPGVLGRRLGRVRVDARPLRAPLRLVIYSDGIRADFDEQAIRDCDPHEACERLMTDHRRPHDDATVLVADLNPSQPPLEQAKAESSPGDRA